MEHFSENGVIHDMYTRRNQERQTPIRLRVLEKGSGKESRTLSSAFSSQIMVFFFCRQVQTLFKKLSEVESHLILEILAVEEGQ